MARKTRAEIKQKFENGDAPSQDDFADLIDSASNYIDDDSVPDGIAVLDAGSFVPDVNISSSSVNQHITLIDGGIF